MGLRSTIGGNVAHLILACYCLSVQNQHQLAAYLLCTTNCFPHHTVLTHLACTLGIFNSNWAIKHHQFLDFLNSTQLVQVNHVIVALCLYFSVLLKWSLESIKTGYHSYENHRTGSPPSKQNMYFVKASYLFSSQLHPVNSQALWTSKTSQAAVECMGWERATELPLFPPRSLRRPY